MQGKNGDSLGRCPVCGSGEWRFLKENNIGQVLKPEMFKITDSNYGISGELWKCETCGFIKCSDVDKPGDYYTTLEDTEYVDAFEERTLRAQVF